MTGEPRAEMSRPAAHVMLHVTVFLWGFTAILGRQITIAAVPLVFYRLLVTVAIMTAVVRLRGQSLRVTRTQALHYGLVGALIALHWLCFYGSVKQAGIATGVLTLSTITFFTAVFEPIVFKRRVDVGELAIGAVVVVGVALLIKLELEADLLGLALGLGSAVFAAAFGVLNGKFARGEHPERLLLFEMLAALAVTSLVFVGWPAQLVTPWHHTYADVVWLLVLGLGCTVVPQLWALRVLRVLSPFTVAVTVNLEPVYSLVMAAILYTDAEPLTARFCVGAAVLLALVGLNARRRARR